MRLVITDCKQSRRAMWNYPDVVPLPLWGVVAMRHDTFHRILVNSGYFAGGNSDGFTVLAMEGDDFVMPVAPRILPSSP
jgi:hypothetical protein